MSAFFFVNLDANPIKLIEVQKDIFQKIEEAGKPDFGDILTRSFEFFKLVWQEGLVHALITMVLMLPVMIMIYVPYVAFFFSAGAFNNYNHDGEYYSQEYMEPDFLLYLPWMILFGAVVFVLIFIAQAVALAITAHFFKVCKKIDTGKPQDVGGYFYYLKHGNFKKMFLLALASFGIALAATLLCYFPLFYVMVPLQLLVVIFVFNEDLSVSEIIKASFKLGHKFWLIIFGLIIVSSLIAQLGILLCFVGVFITAYFVHIPIYFVYKDTIGFNDDPLVVEPHSKSSNQ